MTDPAPAAPAYDPRDAWDPMHAPGGADRFWTTDNAGEAGPGVQTPLSGRLWAEMGDTMMRTVAHAMGVLSAAERVNLPSGPDPATTLFFGRLALQVDYMATIGDRVPGTSGEQAVLGLFSQVPEGMVFAPTRRRYPMIAAKLPVAAIRSCAEVRRLAAPTDAWWREQVPRLADLDLPAAIDLFAEGRRRYEHTITVHSLALLSALQPTLEALTKLVERAGVGDVGALSGSGGAELAIIEDLWRAARGGGSLDTVVANHGFHGPLEGELSSRVWREDRAPLERMLAAYADRGEEEDPSARDRAARARLPERQRAVAAQFPSARRPAVRAVLALGARLLPLRGVGKRSFLQSFDVARGSARRAGVLLADAGRLADPDDVFYLTPEELTGRLPGDARELVAKRRERRREYQALTLPSVWRGLPRAVPVATGEGHEAPQTVTGMGVSAGVVEGPVRVVLDPTFADVEPGEVLVTPTTDPSWASIMFISAALVVDIGGPLSHAAVVARELGVPCVVGTRSGTRDLRTGDRVRVDGSAGTVEVIARA